MGKIGGMKQFEESSLGVQKMLPFPGMGYETYPSVPKISSDRVCSIKKTPQSILTLTEQRAILLGDGFYPLTASSNAHKWHIHNRVQQ